MQSATIEILAKNLDGLHTYYYKDTYLVKSPKLLIIKNPNDLLSQKDFGDLMNEHGYNMDAKKIHMLRKSGKPYWLKEEIETYIYDLQIKNRHSN